MKLNTVRLKQELIKRYMNGTDLAKATGITRNSIYRLMRGENQPSAKTLRLICEALDLDPLEIVDVD